MASTYPFISIPGHAHIKRALILLAIQPRLKGLLIGGPAGSGKSTLVRSFIDFLAQSRHHATPARELPLNATSDRLLGGLDIQQTLATGQRKSAQGVLASADTGMIYADQINLLDSGATGLLASALDSERVQVERDGLSEEHRSRFVLIGTFDPAEGAVATPLRERVAFIADDSQIPSPEERVEVMSMIQRFDEDPRRFVEEQAAQSCALLERIVSARSICDSVRITKASIQRLSEASLALGIHGNRMDVFAVAAARTNAALVGRRSVAEDDLIEAIRLVLLPRARRLPQQTTDSPVDQPEETAAAETELESPTREDEFGTAEEMIIRARDFPFRIELDVNSSKAAGSSSRRRTRAAEARSGRAYRTSERPDSKQIAVAATIRAAAAHQHQTPRKSNREGSKAIRVRTHDLRYKHFKSRPGTLFIFAVDASGSMAVNRMSQAKGAMLRMLERAYINRDQVAMISFRKAGAQVLLYPTRSVELGRRVIDALPAGGGTPLASAIIEAMNLARLAKLRANTQIALLVFTDGRANVPARGDNVREELAILGDELRTRGLAAYVIDTRSRFTTGAEAELLAELLKAKYIYLPRPGADSICQEIEWCARH